MRSYWELRLKRPIFFQAFLSYGLEAFHISLSKLIHELPIKLRLATGDRVSDAYGGEVLNTFWHSNRSNFLGSN